MRCIAWVLALTACAGAAAQWTLQESHTTASLRGIHAVSAQVAWASGSGGTVLRTVDGGARWQVCAVPDGDKDGGKLDFRGVQGFDASTAIVMSSGKGELSRLYKTVDGCGTWKLLFINSVQDGFWDALARVDDNNSSDLIVLGDPVNGHFTMLVLDTRNAQSASLTPYKGPTFASSKPLGLKAKPGEASFAASNSSIFACADGVLFWIGTGGTSGARVIRAAGHGSDNFIWMTHPSYKIAMGNRSDSSGVFSISFKSRSDEGTRDGVIVGGDYKLPEVSTRSAAFTHDHGEHWNTASTPPHGYRSAVAYDSTTKSWITVGPNGTDVSADDGHKWRALTPGTDEPADADKNWNALSLPFVVGAKGRIGVLREGAVAEAKGGSGKK